MKIYGDSNSGNCLKVKWVCDYLKLPYTWIEIDTLKGGSRTADFLKLNPWGQVPTVEFDDGRTLAQSNAIIRYVAVCRFHMVYLGKKVSELDPEKVKRGVAALDHLERQLGRSRYLAGDTFS